MVLHPQVQVIISSSNFPRFDVNPNTGTAIWPVNDTTTVYTANNTIIVSPNYPSSIILPIRDYLSNPLTFL
ncbi:MAG: CocE/NonD family hydrolase C-terminal non-catalytic domain-containing protein [Promethearchaeota archaeon]